MKYLEIRDNKGYYLKDEVMVEIDKINKDDLLLLLDHAREDDFEMDDYVETDIQNKAHQIIYQNIHTKLGEFLTDKERFDREVDSMYSEAVGEYGADLEAESDEDLDAEEVDSEETPAG